MHRGVGGYYGRLSSGERGPGQTVRATCMSVCDLMCKL